MARKALISKQAKMYTNKFVNNKKVGTKYYNRCRICGRAKGYVRNFGMCRCCLREYASKGFIMGLKKASR